VRDVLLGVDVGTSACKVTAFTADGAELASASMPYPIRRPAPGHVEQDPRDWLEAVYEGIAKVLADSELDPARIAGVGVDGQSWACVPLSAEGEVLADTPIWMDTRAAAICAAAEQRVGAERILALSGNRLAPSYTTGKILWFRKHRPDVYRRTRWFLQSNSYIVYGLTGAITQDASQGYGLHVIDVATGGYDDAMCDALAIDRQLLPEIVESHDVVGHVTPAAAARTGLRAGTPVVAGGLDAACGTLGAGVHLPGQVQEQGGQAGGMSIVVDRPVADRRLILSRHVVPGAWLLQGGTVAGGASLRWLVGEVGETERAAAQASGRGTFELVSDLAGTIRAGAAGTVFLPYLAGERSPIWDPQATGVFFGLTFATSRAHLYRATMEGVAYALRHNIEVAEELGLTVGDMHAIGGAATSPVWTQIKADIAGRTIHVPASETATTLGAAILAGVGTGVYRDWTEAIARTVQVRRTHRPDVTTAEVYDRGFATYRELYVRLAPTMAAAAASSSPTMEGH